MKLPFTELENTSKGAGGGKDSDTRSLVWDITNSKCLLRHPGTDGE